MASIGARALSRLIALANTKAFDLFGGINVANARNFDFGAVGDGVTDDTEAIQAAVDAVIAAGSKVVYLPNGTYYVTALNNADKVIFMGDGASFTGGYNGKIYQLGDDSKGLAELREFLNYMPVDGGEFDGGEPGGPTIDGGTY